MGHRAEFDRRRAVYDSAMDRGVAIVVGSFLLLAACGGSGSDSDASTTAATAATSPASTTAAVTTTDVPATTIGTDAQLAAAEQAYLDAFDAYIAAARDPSNPDLRADIERLYTGPNLEFTISQLDGFVREGWVARPADEPSRTIILLSPQFLPDRTDFVELVCLRSRHRDLRRTRRRTRRFGRARHRRSDGPTPGCPPPAGRRAVEVGQRREPCGTRYA